MPKKKPAKEQPGALKGTEWSPRRRFALYLPNDLAVELRVAGIRGGRSASKIVEELVRGWLAEQKRKGAIP